MTRSNTNSRGRALICAIAIIFTLDCPVSAEEAAGWSKLLVEADKVSVQGHQTPALVRQAQDSAIVIATKAVHSTPSEDREGVATVLNHLGIYHFRNGNYQAADSLWRVSANIGAAGGVSLEQKEYSLFCLAICRRFLPASSSVNEIQEASRALMDTVEFSKDSSAVRRSWMLVEISSRLGLFDDLDKYAQIGWATYQTKGGDTYSAMRALILEGENISKKLNSNTPQIRQNQDSAISLGRLALATVERIYGPSDANVAFVLQRLGDYQMRRGDRLGAAASWERAWHINERSLGPENIEYQGSVDRMASVFRSRGQFLAAEKMARLALELRIKTQGPGHPETAAMYSNLGRLCQLMGKFTEAERCYREALNIRQHALERLPEDIAQCYSELASLASDQGRFVQAEKYNQQAYSVCREALGDHHVMTLDIRQQLAQLHLQWGDDSAAVEILTDVLARRTKFLGGDHPALLNGTLGLAKMKAKLKQFAAADSLIRNAGVIAEKSLDKDSWSYAGYLASKGDAQLAMDRNAEAVETLSRCLALQERFLTKSDGRQLAVLMDLGGAEEAVGNLDSAAAVYAKADSIVRRSDLPWVAGAADAMDQLAKFAMERRQTERAFNLAQMAFERRLKVFRDGARMLSESEAVRFQQSVRQSRDEMLSAYFCLDSANKSRLGAVADAIIATKGWVTEELFWRERMLTASSDPLLRSEMDSLQEDRTRLAGMYLRIVDSAENRGLLDTLAVLTERINRSERRLARNSDVYRSGWKNSDADCASVQAMVPVGSALIEYIRYVDWSRQDAAPGYAALCLAPDRKVLVNLGSAGKIDSAIKAYRSHLEKVILAYGLPSAQDVSDYRSVASTVTNLVWAPVAGYFSDSALVFVAPDAQLYTVSFAGLPNKQGYLIESHPVHYLRAGRDLLPNLVSANTGLVAVGDPDFSSDPKQSRLASTYDSDEWDKTDPLRGALDNCSSLRLRNLARLPGSRSEVEEVAKLWAQFSGETSHLLIGEDASEDNFRRLAVSSRVLHLASHAYQIGDSCGDQTTRHILRNNRSLLSGIFLAGVTHRGADTRNDGVLTATEISTLDLHGVKSVVLSACQTALGSVDAEGVTGLMRSFRIAGARTVIGSLWPVGDNTSATFISSLYARPGAPLPEVMRDVACAEIRRLRQRGQPDHPVLWAPFIATGDWHSLR